MTKKSKDATSFKVCECEPLFAFVKNPKTEKVNIVIGQYKVSQKDFESFKECEEYVKSKPYELIINSAVLFSKLQEDETKKETESGK